MGGQVGLVHVTVLGDWLAACLAASARGAGILLPGGVRPHLSTLSHACCAADCCRRFCCRVPPFFCCVSGGYALSLSVAPCFLIVYAPAMRSVAYYALGCGCLCARLTVQRCRAGRVVVDGVSARAGRVVRLAFC